MDTALPSVLIGGGLSVSVSISTATKAGSQSISSHLSTSSLRLTARHRNRRRLPLLASSSESPPAQLAAASTESQSRSSRWVVVMDTPPAAAGGSGVSRAEAVDYYAATLAQVVGSEKEAQMRICEASWDGTYEFRCEIDEDASKELAKMPGVLSVQLDMGNKSEKDNHSLSLSTANLVSISDGASTSSSGKNEFWLVRMEKPGVEVVTKAQMVDHYTQILMKVLGNEQDAQVSIYHVSWDRDYGFCCHIDEECAKELAGEQLGLSYPFMFLECYLFNPIRTLDQTTKITKIVSGDDGVKSSEGTGAVDIKTKRLFVTGLSFYTSEKTLRAAFEPFGELVEVKIIMDRISKRSKGYAFVEYTTEEAGGAALKAMNGQIINGWMIVVDVAKTRSRDRLSGGSNQAFRPHYQAR
ncbi:organelle RRM protein1 [Zea mays]|uniref:Organelle RRM domain-containing protein 1, chloroplastic n=1 Tax=Zea mays TaxID=4577 RepID=A0A1D6HJ84_MAIZE|nr:organelle RRM protein1 [Zea mays]